MAAGGSKVTLIGTEPTTQTVVIEGEDHTLGNSLRYALMRDPSVTFCGYTIPHPSEVKIHVRVQTREDTTSKEAVVNALNGLIDVCAHVQNTFTAAIEEYEATH